MFVESMERVSDARKVTMSILLVPVVVYYCYYSSHAAAAVGVVQCYQHGTNLARRRLFLLPGLRTTRRPQRQPEIPPASAGPGAGAGHAGGERKEEEEEKTDGAFLSSVASKAALPSTTTTTSTPSSFSLASRERKSSTTDDDDDDDGDSLRLYDDDEGEHSAVTATTTLAPNRQEEEKERRRQRKQRRRKQRRRGRRRRRLLRILRRTGRQNDDLMIGETSAAAASEEEEASSSSSLSRLDLYQERAAKIALSFRPNDFNPPRGILSNNHVQTIGGMVVRGLRDVELPPPGDLILAPPVRGAGRRLRQTLASFLPAMGDADHAADSDADAAAMTTMTTTTTTTTTTTMPHQETNKSQQQQQQQQGDRPGVNAPHQQTPSPPRPRPRNQFWDVRERITTPDGDWFDADYKFVEDDHDDRSQNSLVILMHGLEANSESPLTKDIAQAYVDQGLNVVCLNFRGCSSSSSSTLSSSSSSSSSDLNKNEDAVNAQLGGYHLGFTQDLLYYLSLTRDRVQKGSLALEKEEEEGRGRGRGENRDDDGRAQQQKEEGGENPSRPTSSSSTTTTTTTVLPTLYLSGYSLGANIVLKALGELGEAAVDEYNIRGAAVACPPLDQEREIQYMDSPGFNQMVYCKTLLTNFRKKLDKQIEVLYPDEYDEERGGLLPYGDDIDVDDDPHRRRRRRRDHDRGGEGGGEGKEDADRRSLPAFDYPSIQRAKTIAEFDRAFVAPVFGFANEREYWRQSSSIHYLESIAVPTFLLRSADDPLFDPHFFPIGKSREYGGAAPIKMVRTQYGGHLGFCFHRDRDRDRHDDEGYQYDDDDDDGYRYKREEGKIVLNHDKKQQSPPPPTLPRKKTNWLATELSRFIHHVESQSHDQ